MARHAILTGGSSGIGLALARRLAARGFHLSLLARGTDRLEVARAALQQDFPDVSVRTRRVDVSDAEATAEAIEGAIATQGSPQLLVTSAGIARPGHFHELPLEVFEQTMRINYFGTLHAVRAALPMMEAGARVVMLSSGAGLVGVYGYSAYGPSKFAIRGLAEVLRCELKPRGIGVSVVFPPDTDTPQLAEENRTKPAETHAISGNAKTWSADEVAALIERGIDRGRFVIAPGWEMAALARLHSLINPVLHRYFDALVAKIRREQA